MRRSSMIIAGMVLAMGAVNAEADDTAVVRTTSDLGATCASDDAADRHFCFGFILGAGQLYTELVRADTIPELACPETPPTLDELRSTFVVWTAANPSLGSTRAIDGLIQAAAEAWPCD